MPFEKSKKFDIVEVEVWEEEALEKETNDIHQQLIEIQNPAENQQSVQVNASRGRRRRAKRKTKEPKYNWAFFLACLFIGLGFTATFKAPIGLFAGLGLGFLFFVDPIYQKVMDRINDL